MNDIIYEQVVHRDKTKTDRLMRIIADVILVLFTMFGIFFIGMAAPILAIVIWVVLHKFYFAKIEEDYEYNLVNQDLTFSILGKGEEKESVMTVSLGQMDVVAPRNVERVSSVKPDYFHIYSPISDEMTTYAILYEKEERKHCILFDPDQKMLEAMQNFLGPKLIQA